MRRRLILALLGGMLMLGSFTMPPVSKTDYVYICEGRYSKVYHKSDKCRGLSNCSTKIYKVTLEEARKLGRRPCKLEY